MSKSSATSPHSSITTRWKELRKEKPGLRTRELAAELETTEAQLLDSAVGHGVVRLRGPWAPLLADLEELGKVMALTRNEQCVIEKIGRYRNVQDFGAMGQVLDEGVDLRLFLNRWGSGYGVTGNDALGLRSGLQFFDEGGVAVHKVFLKHFSVSTALEPLLERHADPDQAPGLVVSPAPGAAPTQADGEVDVAGLEREWGELRDTHDFHRLLRRFSVGRVQAFRLVNPTLARQVETKAHRTLLEAVSTSATPIMIFVNSSGTVQIHSGPVSHIKLQGPWFNILDPGFSLHLLESGVASAWVVRKPVDEGHVTALELFDAEERQIALITGKRPVDEPEEDRWRNAVDGLDDVGR